MPPHSTDCGPATRPAGNLRLSPESPNEEWVALSKMPLIVVVFLLHTRRQCDLITTDEQDVGIIIVPGMPELRCRTQNARYMPWHLRKLSPRGDGAIGLAFRGESVLSVYPVTDVAQILDACGERRAEVGGTRTCSLVRVGSESSPGACAQGWGSGSSVGTNQPSSSSSCSNIAPTETR